MDAAFVPLRPPLPLEHPRPGAEATVRHRVALVEGPVVLSAGAHHRRHGRTDVGNLASFLEGYRLVRREIEVVFIEELEGLSVPRRLVISDPEEFTL